MRKILLIVSVVVLLFTLSLPVVAAAEVASPYEYASAFATAYPQRSVLGGREEQSSEVLSGFLTALGYQVETPEYTYRYTSAETNASITCKYRHVLGTKDNKKGRKVVIGTYYGGFDPEDGSSAGQGAEVALSVGALQYIAASLINTFTEYDLVIAFWGGVAVSDFDVTKCGVDLDTVALYVNLDGIAAGTNDYWYCDDVPRSHSELFEKVIAELQADISEPPVYKRPSLLYASGGAYSATHLGLLGVNRDFLNEDVPCIAFVGGAWEYDVGLYRYEGKNEISGTSNDTFETINARNGGEEVTKKRLLAVSDVIIAALRDGSLTSYLDAAEKDVSGADLDSSLAFYLITIIGAVAVIALFIILLVRQGKDRREAIWEAQRPSEEEEDNAPPTYDDPFSEFEPRDTVGQDDKNGGEEGDDVFRF